MSPALTQSEMYVVGDANDHRGSRYQYVSEHMIQAIAQQRDVIGHNASSLANLLQCLIVRLRVCLPHLAPQ
jgi:hypothetical protein